MEKSKQLTSAAQRREEGRQQRQQQNKKRSRKRVSRNNPWPLLITILVVVVAVVGIFLFVANQQQTKTATTSQSGSNDNGASSALKTISSLDPTVLANVGAGNAQNLMHALPANAMVPKGPTGKPMVLYEGADFCPYCAAQRWSLIIALSRFGQFSHVDPLVSSEGSFITYTFYKSAYTSQYVDFVPIETTDNQGKKLETPTAEQAQLINTYNAPPYTSSKGSIPFILIGNKQTSTGAYYSPEVLSGLSYTDVVNQLNDSNSTAAQGMLGAANDLTAAICQVTNNQPAKVCNSAPIPSIQKSLPSSGTSFSTDGGALATIDLPYSAVVTRRNDEFIL